MSIQDTLQKIQAAGFSLTLDGNDIVVTPPGKLNDQQRQYLKEHKGEILACLRSSDTLLDAELGDDIPAANDRVVVHVPEYQTATGKRYSFDLDVPRANLPSLRQSLRFELIGDQGGGSILGAPGQTEDELRDVLGRKCGDRLESINGEFLVPDFVSPIVCKDINGTTGGHAFCDGEIIDGECAEVVA